MTGETKEIDRVFIRNYKRLDVLESCGGGIVNGN